MEFERRSSGVAKGGLATGIVGTSLGALNSMALLGAGNGLFGNWFGRSGWNNGWGVMPYAAVPQTVVVNSDDRPNCNENTLVNRYELNLVQENASLKSDIALRDANTYNDQKTIELYKYVDGRFQEFERELSRQAVINQKTEDSFILAQKDLQCCCDKLQIQIDREAYERRCEDNTIITYTNATFYPKSVADVTVGTTTTPQATYNPLSCSCSCGNNNGNR